MRLETKIALVTGAASGFGAEIARTFAREGARVALLDLNADGAQAVAASIGSQAVAIAGDVTSAHDVASAVERTLATMAASTSWSTMPAGPTATGRCSR